jgi:serine/threonine-protein kinase
MEAWALLAIAESQHYLFANHTEMQLAKVREAAERAIKLGPDASEAHRAMGSFYYCLRDYDRALVELNLAKERAPNVADTQFYIGLVQRRQGEVERCIASMLAASKLDPLNEDIWVNLGRTYRGTRRFGEARAMFDRALATAPNDAEVIAQKAETFVAEGDLATAWSMIKDIEFGPLERGLDLSAAMLIYQRRFDEAARLFSETLATRQNGPQLFEAVRQTLLGDVYQLKGERDKAQPLFAQAAETLKLLRSEGDDGFLLLDALVGATANLNDRSEVARTAGAIQERIAKDKWGFLRDEEAIARAYTTLGDFDRALPLLQHALSAPGAESLTPALLRFDPFWDPIRNDPRFQKLAGGKQ